MAASALRYYETSRSSPAWTARACGGSSGPTSSRRWRSSPCAARPGSPWRRSSWCWPPGAGPSWKAFAARKRDQLRAQAATSRHRRRPAGPRPSLPEPECLRLRTLPGCAGGRPAGARRRRAGAGGAGSPWPLSRRDRRRTTGPAGRTARSRASSAICRARSSLFFCVRGVRRLGDRRRFRRDQLERIADVARDRGRALDHRGRRW